MSKTSHPADRADGSDARELRRQAADWLLRVGASDDPVLRADLQAWLAENDGHRVAYRSVERAWRLAEALPSTGAEPGTAVTDEGSAASAAAVPGRGALAVPPAGAWAGGVRRRALGVVTAALAAALLLVLLPGIRLQLVADHLTGGQELRQVVLDDGSLLYLDAESAIAVDYTEPLRAVALLAGQAFFEVVPMADRPFTVEADGVTVRVTGTAFSVQTVPDRVVVAVRSGSVAVEVDGGGSTDLVPGERLTVNRADGTLVRTPIVPEDVAAWRDGRLVVDGATFAEVVEELERHHRGMILVTNDLLAARRITGVFDLARPAEALRAIVRSQGGTLTEVTPYLLVVSGR